MVVRSLRETRTAWKRWRMEFCREVQINGLTLAECIRSGRTSDALLALDSGANPNSEDQQGKSVLCIAISLGNAAVVKKLLEHGADISTYYPNTEIPVGQESTLMGWIKRLCGEFLLRFPLAILRYTRFRYHPLLNPFERFFPFQQVTQMVVSGRPLESRQILEALLLPAELLCLLYLGSVYLRGSLQQICNEALQSWSFQSCFLQVALLTYIRQFHQYLERRFRPLQRRTHGNDALTELLAYTPDGSETAMLLLQKGIDLGSRTQVGGQGHELLQWAVHRGYINVVGHLLGRGVPTTLGLPKSKEPNRQLNYYELYHFNKEPLLIRAATNLQKDMVSLLLGHTTGDYTSALLNAALVECAQITPPTDLQLLERNEIIEYLLKRGADPNVRLRDGRSLLSCLCRHMGEDALIVLLYAGANPASADSNGETALHHACFYTQNEDSKIIDILIDAGTPINHIDDKGHTALWKAASWGRPYTALKLVQRGANVDLRGEGSTTPLMEACIHNGLDIVQTLILCGADPNGCTDDDTPLLAALRRNSPSIGAEIVQVLLDAGALPVLSLNFRRQPLVESVHSLKGDWTVAILQAAQAAGNVSKSILNEALKEACVSPRDYVRYNVVPRLNNYIPLKAVKALVEAGGDPLLVVMETCTVLHALCQSTNSSGDEEEVLKVIVERGISLNTQELNSGRTPLHIAVQSSKLQTVKTLLELGASVDIVDLTSQTPLLLACQAKPREWTRDSSYDLGERKLSAHPQYQGTRGEAALQFELRGRYREVDLSMAEEDIVEYLLDYGANPLVADKAGLTPLHHACKLGNPITAGRILRGRDRLSEFMGRPTRRDYGFFIILSARDTDGRLPLHWAARSGNVKIVQLLLAADLNRSSSSVEHDGLSLPAGQVEEKDSMPPLLVKSSNDIINAVDNAGYTALHWAAKEGHEDIVHVLLKETSVVDLLAVSVSGHTAGELAAACGHSGIVEVLETWKELYYTQARTIIMMNALRGGVFDTDVTDKAAHVLQRRCQLRSVETNM